MREPYHQPGRSTQASGTLERLHSALGALEDRMATARRTNPTRRPSSSADLAAIRARQNALDNERDPDRHRADSLRSEIARLRGDIDRQIQVAETRQREAPRADGAEHRATAAKIDALHEEIRSLRPDMAGQRAALGAIEALRDEISAMRPGAIDQRSTTSAIEAMRDDIRALRLEPSGMEDVRDAIDRLRGDLTALARDDSVRDLTDRYSTIEREIVSLPQSLPSRQDVASLADRLEQLDAGLQALPGAQAMDSLEDQLRALAVAVERLVAHETEIAPANLSAMEGRLDEISRAISAIPAPPPPAPGIDADVVDRIEARIAALATQVDQIALAAQDDAHAAQLESITGQLEALRGEQHNRIDQPGEAIDALSARVEEIARAIEELGHVAARPAPADPELIGELRQRLEAIDGQVQTAAEVSERSAEGVIASLDNRMAQLAQLIDQSERAQADLPSMAQLEQRLEDIAHALTQGPAAPAVPAGFDNLEAQIARLSDNLSAGPTNPPDQDSILTAARMAAEEAVSRAGGSAGETPQALERLTDDLRALENLARDTDHRNTSTFEAIHDTLLKVVDHLAGLESSLRNGPASAAALLDTPTDDPNPAPLEIDNPPPIAPEVAERPVEPLSPARAAAQAALAALDGDNVAGKVQSEADAGKRSLLRNMTDRFSRGTATETVSPPETDDLDTAMTVQPPVVVDDQPIEPSTDQVALADIMARVREERDDGSAAPNPAVRDAGKSDFIAAARRAAKAAAADATVASSKDGAAADGSDRSALTSMLSNRRRPLLIGAGAILLALLSVPLIRGFVMAPPQADANLVAEQPPAIVDTLPDETAQAPAAAVPQSTDEPADLAAGSDDVEPVARNVLGGAPDPNIPVLANGDADTPLATETALGNTTDNGDRPEAPIEVDATDVTAASLTIDDIPSDIGPIALREAAAGSDAQALHVIGDRLASDEDDGDMTEALRFYERAAELGYAPAQYTTGNFYEKGFGTERDYETAKDWYQLAAEAGNLAAMHNLAVLHASGVDGEPDYDVAATWFMNAAELGLRDSQFNLGILSAKGQGVPQDLVESYKWFALAAASGDEDAASKRDEVANVLRPDQLETARGVTALWKAKPIDEEANIVTVPDAWQTDGALTAATADLDDDEMRQAVRNIQAILNNAGYDAGPVDGIMGERTRDAIIAFQRDNGLEPTGAVDQALVDRLLQTNGA